MILPRARSNLAAAFLPLQRVTAYEAGQFARQGRAPEQALVVSTHICRRSVAGPWYWDDLIW